jgi:hypothetical protein
MLLVEISHISKCEKEKKIFWSDNLLSTLPPMLFQCLLRIVINNGCPLPYYHHYRLFAISLNDRCSALLEEN